MCFKIHHSIFLYPSYIRAIPIVSVWVTSHPKVVPRKLCQYCSALGEERFKNDFVELNLPAPFINVLPMAWSPQCSVCNSLRKLSSLNGHLNPRCVLSLDLITTCVVVKYILSSATTHSVILDVHFLYEMSNYTNTIYIVSLALCYNC